MRKFYVHYKRVIRSPFDITEQNDDIVIDGKINPDTIVDKLYELWGDRDNYYFIPLSWSLIEE